MATPNIPDFDSVSMLNLGGISFDYSTVLSSFNNVDKAVDVWRILSIYESLWEHDPLFALAIFKRLSEIQLNPLCDSLLKDSCLYLKLEGLCCPDEETNKRVSSKKKASPASLLPQVPGYRVQKFPATKKTHTCLCQFKCRTDGSNCFIKRENNGQFICKMQYLVAPSSDAGTKSPKYCQPCFVNYISNTWKFAFTVFNLNPTNNLIDASFWYSLNGAVNIGTFKCCNPSCKFALNDEIVHNDDDDSSSTNKMNIYSLSIVTHKFHLLCDFCLNAGYPGELSSDLINSCQTCGFNLNKPDVDVILKAIYPSTLSRK